MIIQGKIFAANFSVDTPYILSVAGSKGKVLIWNLEDNAGVRKAFPSMQHTGVSSGHYQPVAVLHSLTIQQAPSATARKELLTVESDNEDEDEDEDEDAGPVGDDAMDGDGGWDEDEAEEEDSEEDHV